MTSLKGTNVEGGTGRRVVTGQGLLSVRLQSFLTESRNTGRFILTKHPEFQVL
jgi:hypothetical protein